MAKVGKPQNPKCSASTKYIDDTIISEIFADIPLLWCHSLQIIGVSKEQNVNFMLVTQSILFTTIFTYFT